MKKVILMVFLCLITIEISQAKRIQVMMRVLSSGYDHKKNGHIRHAPSVKTYMPIVELEDNIVNVSSVTTGSPVSVDLTDGQGNCIYTYESYGSNTNLAVVVPVEIIEEANVIRITLDGVVYVGEIY
jgi:hypothetical protein